MIFIWYCYFVLPLWNFWNDFFYLCSDEIQRRKIQKVTSKKKQDTPSKKCKISLLHCFQANKYNFINHFMARFMYENDLTLSWFLFCWYLYNLVFSDKKYQIPKILPVSFCAVEMSTKFWDFAASIGFNT